MTAEAFSSIVIDRKHPESGWNIENPKIVDFETPSSAGKADFIVASRVGAVTIIKTKNSKYTNLLGIVSTSEAF